MASDGALSQDEADRLIAMSDKRREEMLAAIDERWAAHLREHAAHEQAHERAHDADREVARLRETSAAQAFEAHEQAHFANEEAVKTALASVDRLADTHATAHEREHTAHEQRHEDQAEAIRRGEVALDKRLAALNGVYDQMREQARSFASAEVVATMQAQIDRRFEESRRERDLANETLRARVEAIEKKDVKGEGRAAGMGTFAAIIVAAITLVGSVLGILIVLSNLLTAPRPV